MWGIVRIDQIQHLVRNHKNQNLNLDEVLNREI